jgi:hypothetical protein
LLFSNSEEWSTLALFRKTAQTQTQQSWEPLIYAYVTLIQHDACEKKDSSSIAGMTVDDHCPLKNRTDGGLASCPVKLRERSGEMAEQSNHKRKISDGGLPEMA